MMAEKKKIEVTLSPEVARGVYANAVEVAHTEAEFTLTFTNISSGEAVARVFISPLFIRSVIRVLLENVRKYEKGFQRRLRKPKQPPPGIGFV